MMRKIEPTKRMDIVLKRVEEAAADRLGDEARRVVFPIALLLVLDEHNGGDATARELVKRCWLLDGESGDAIDFYYLGWAGQPGPNKSAIRFDIGEFHACRRVLTTVGMAQFGGNADLIVLDVEATPDECVLRFDAAMRMDLSVAIKKKQIDTLGSVLQALISAAKAVESSPGIASPTRAISDRLGVSSGWTAMLDKALSTFGSWIGADRLQAFATGSIGPRVAGASLAQALAAEEERSR